jgi:TctA family transporter
MELSKNFSSGFGVALSLQNLLYCQIGFCSAPCRRYCPDSAPWPRSPLLMPLTFSISPVAAIVMLAGIYYGAQYGCSTTAILVTCR